MPLLLDALFSKYFPGKVLVTIHSLEIDLGSLLISQSDEEWLKLISEKLEQQLFKMSPSSDQPIFKSKLNEDLRRDEQDILLFYLQHGILPYWTNPGIDKKYLDSLLSKVLNGNSTEFLKQLTLLGKDTDVIRRLGNHFSEKSILKVFESLQPDQVKRNKSESEVFLSLILFLNTGVSKDGIDSVGGLSETTRSGYFRSGTAESLNDLLTFLSAGMLRRYYSGRQSDLLKDTSDAVQMLMVLVQKSGGLVKTLLDTVQSGTSSFIRLIELLRISLRRNASIGDTILLQLLYLSEDQVDSATGFKAALILMELGGSKLLPQFQITNSINFFKKLIYAEKGVFVLKTLKITFSDKGLLKLINNIEPLLVDLNAVEVRILDPLELDIVKQGQVELSSREILLRYLNTGDSRQIKHGTGSEPEGFISEAVTILSELLKKDEATLIPLLDAVIFRTSSLLRLLDLFKASFRVNASFKEMILLQLQLFAGDETVNSEVAHAASLVLIELGGRKLLAPAQLKNSIAFFKALIHSEQEPSVIKGLKINFSDKGLVKLISNLEAVRLKSDKAEMSSLDTLLLFLNVGTLRPQTTSEGLESTIDLSEAVEILSVLVQGNHFFIRFLLKMVKPETGSLLRFIELVQFSLRVNTSLKDSILLQLRLVTYGHELVDAGPNHTAFLLFKMLEGNEWLQDLRKARKVSIDLWKTNKQIDEPAIPNNRLVGQQIESIIYYLVHGNWKPGKPELSLAKAAEQLSTYLNGHRNGLLKILNQVGGSMEQISRLIEILQLGTSRGLVNYGKSYLEFLFTVIDEQHRISGQVEDTSKHLNKLDTKNWFIQVKTSFSSGMRSEVQSIKKIADYFLGPATMTIEQEIDTLAKLDELLKVNSTSLLALIEHVDGEKEIKKRQLARQGLKQYFMDADKGTTPEILSSANYSTESAWNDWTLIRIYLLNPLKIKNLETETRVFFDRLYKNNPSLLMDWIKELYPDQSILSRLSSLVKESSFTGLVQILLPLWASELILSKRFVETKTKDHALLTMLNSILLTFYYQLENGRSKDPVGILKDQLLSAFHNRGKASLTILSRIYKIADAIPEHVEFNLFFSSVQVLWQEQGAQRSLLEEKIQHSYDEIEKLAINHSLKDQSELKFSASPEIKDIIPAFYRQIELKSLIHPVTILKEQLSSFSQKERKRITFFLDKLGQLPEQDPQTVSSSLFFSAVAILRLEQRLKLDDLKKTITKSYDEEVYLKIVNHLGIELSADWMVNIEPAIILIELVPFFGSIESSAIRKDIQEINNLFVKSLAEIVHIKQVFWSSTLKYLLTNEAFTLFDYIPALLQSGSKATGTSEQQAIDQLLFTSKNDQGSVAVRLLPVLNLLQGWKEGEHKRQADLTKLEIPVLESISNLPEELLINNAGIVILYPFISMYLERLKLIEGVRAKDALVQMKAIHALQYLVTGEEDHQEYDLVFIKVLCGFPVTKMYVKQARLNLEEKDLADGLLKHVIGLWSMLGSTSIDGLRTTFLKRNGKLNFTADALFLTVEGMPFDMLLDHLPWSISMLNFSWMEKNIHVIWRK